MCGGRFQLARDEAGIIVLVPLIVFTVLLVVVVVAGKVLYPPAPVYVMPTRPFKAVAASTGVIYSAGRTVRQLEVGDTVWVVRAGNGLPVLFADSTGQQVVGIAEVMLSPVTRLRAAEVEPIGGDSTRAIG